ncbi:MAG: hypothetical protein ABFR36_06320 [Acidobacteriota bacterium]
MKRSILLLSILLILTGIVFSQSIQVTSPQKDQVWYKGAKVQIKWTETGCSSPYVKINIFKNSITQANFIEQLHPHNSGWTYWTIPTNYVSGKYILRIKADPAQTGCLGDSGVFHIKLNAKLAISNPKISAHKSIKFGKMLKGINVTAPKNGQSYEIGKQMQITWNKYFANYSKVNIDLHHENGNFETSIYKEYNNSGNIFVTMFMFNAIPGDKYFFRIYTSDNKYSGISGFFYVTNPSTQR